jgi:hypothetical protein
MSWYPLNPKLNNEAYKKYFASLEYIFKVQDPSKNWVPYALTNHQREWHSEDVALVGSLATDRVVIKSRNTSFTTSGQISNLMAVYKYPDQVVPFVRLNITRAMDLINDCKKLIRHIRPMLLPDGSKYPFDPELVDTRAAGKIVFPNGVEFRAFPANAQAAESIRGLRIAGSAGIVDESNFMKDFDDIYIALRDAAAGSSRDGKKEFQMNIGTTRKGRMTPFNIWYEKIEKTNALRVFKWPVFDPNKFNISLPITQQNLDPIVHWHSLEDLEKKRTEDKNRFLEEYMAELIDNEEQFYEYPTIMKCLLDGLENRHTPEKDGMFLIGIDVASINDYFVISIFEKIKNKQQFLEENNIVLNSIYGDIYVQRHLFYTRKVELEDMMAHVVKVIEIWKPLRVRIDANGIGFQLGQQLRRRYGGMIDPIRGSRLKGIVKAETVDVNEFLHTNQKTLMANGCVYLLNDEMQINHYSSWDYSYKCESTTEFGHGDITMANGYALLPFDYKQHKGSIPLTNNIMQEDVKRRVEALDVEW